MSSEVGAPLRRTHINRRRRLAAACWALVVLAALGSTAVAAGGPPSDDRYVWHAQPGSDEPRPHKAHIRRRQWLSGVRITEYYPAPERWAVGRSVAAPGLRTKHRIDWLYGALGLSMQGTGIGVDGRFYHISSLGRGAWVTRSGRPTFDGVHDNGPPYWRTGAFWRNARAGVTFPLRTGQWSNGAPKRYVPAPAGIRFSRGHGNPSLRYYRSIAVDPRLIPLGSRVWIPYYKEINGAGGWFRAQDTGGAIKGRRIDVYRPPPPIVDDLGRNLLDQRVYVIPPGG